MKVANCSENTFCVKDIQIKIKKLIFQDFIWGIHMYIDLDAGLV
jgi:hypothetical protein